MDLLGSYGRALGRAPWAIIAIIIAVTLVMGYFSTDFEQSTEEDSFTPDTETADANSIVRDDYGSQRAQISILIESDENVLSRDSLLSMVDLQEKVLDSSVEEILVPTPENPEGIGSPAEVILQSIFFLEAMDKAQEYSSTEGNGEETEGNSSFEECFSMENLQNAFLSKAYSMSTEEKRTILNGGTVNISVPCAVDDIVLDFDPYDPEDLPAITEGAPMAVALDFLLPSDYEMGASRSQMALFVVFIEDDLGPDEKLDYEKELDSAAEDVEGESDDLNLITLGDELISEKINEASGQTQGLLFTLALIMVIVVLIFVFRSFFEIVINVAGLFMAVIWVFGTGGLLGFDYNPALTTVPVLVIALGVDFGIHLTLRYREEIRKGENVKDSITIAEKTVGFAILLAAVTTLIGFLSNLAADSPGIRVFGILNAVGIFSAFVIMSSFVPAARIIKDRWKEKKGKPILKKRSSKNPWGWAKRRASEMGLSKGEMVDSEGAGIMKTILGLGVRMALHPIPVITAVVLLTIGGAYAGAQLEPTFDFRDFLPDGVEEADALKTTVSDFDFTTEQAYILAEGDVTGPAVVFAMIEAQERALEKEDVIESEPIRSPVELGNELSNFSSSTYDPDLSLIWHLNMDKDFDGEVDTDITASNVTAAYSALFEADEERASRVLNKEDGSFTGMVIRIPVNSRGGERAKEVRSQIIDSSEPLEDLEGEELDRVVPTGEAIVSQEVLDSISSSQTQSVVLTFLIALIILTAIFLKTRSSLTLGLVTMLPLILVIAWTTGAMYILKIPLNVVTVTISAISVGLGIDYAVHVTQRFQEDYDRLGDGICALGVAVDHTGYALIGSALTTVVGFAILSFAIIPPLAQFGQVTALSITFALLAAVFILPTFLLLWIRGNTWYRKKFKGEDIPEVGRECRLPSDEL